MTHPHQQEFVKNVKLLHPAFFKGKRVLEFGSRNVNGSIRDEFIDCEYIGVDTTDGVDVDIICYAHKYKTTPVRFESFDVVCSTEMFEHDPYAHKSVGNMLKQLRPGGLLFMTCAGVGRAEHGTKRMGQEYYGPDADFYRNVTMKDFSRWSGAYDNAFSSSYIEHNPGPRDLYFWGIKRSQYAN